MAPSAITPPPETVSELVSAGIKHAVANTAPSVTPHNNIVSTLQELDASKVMFTRNLNPKPVPEPNSPEVTAMNACTDHMITCSWNSTTGWQTPHLGPYGPLSLMPTASVLHYATECFEGMKIYRGYDSRIRLFRPDRNCRRMLGSATRIALPGFDPKELQQLIEDLVSVDSPKWLPKSRPGSFLYLRPTMIASAAALGVQKPKEALLFIIACCFPSLSEPTEAVTPSPIQLGNGNGVAQEKKKPGLKLLASKDDMVRAWPGGFGNAKVGANYGPSLIAQGEARDLGFDQILWLFGPQCEVTEAGASNFFLIWRTRTGRLQLVTAPLGDKVILDGVTRKSVLELAEKRLSATWEDLEGLEIVERKYTMGEVMEAIEEGRLVEAFAAGTAFFIAPVSMIHFRGKDLDIPLSEGTTGKYALVLKTWLKNIMYGKEQHEWGVVIEELDLD
ncbi:hypothetical protein MMC22_006807 [Lobaria immixta]|nr:hypothetical protein [Lobaria immixta]